MFPLCKSLNYLVASILWFVAVYYCYRNLQAHVEKFWKFRSIFMEQYDDTGNIDKGNVDSKISIFAKKFTKNEICTKNYVPNRMVKTIFFGSTSQSSV